MTAPLGILVAASAAAFFWMAHRCFADAVRLRAPDLFFISAALAGHGVLAALLAISAAVECVQSFFRS